MKCLIYILHLILLLSYTPTLSSQRILKSLACVVYSRWTCRGIHRFSAQFWHTHFLLNLLASKDSSSSCFTENVVHCHCIKNIHIFVFNPIKRSIFTYKLDKSEYGNFCFVLLLGFSCLYFCKQSLFISQTMKEYLHSWLHCVCDFSIF